MNIISKQNNTPLLLRFRNNPNIYYSMSIAATWAGVGSLMMAIEMMQTNGLIPFLIWASGNTLACIAFGTLAPRIAYLRRLFNSRIVKLMVGLMCPFQIWLTMNGIQNALVDTPLPKMFGIILSMIFAVAFIAIMWKNGMIRNVLTDYIGWLLVYILILFLTVSSLVYTRGDTIPITMGVYYIPSACRKFFLLIAGPFLYPYFYEILNYNDNNGDQVQKVNVTRVFVNGGLLFGFYLLFTALLAITRFSPTLNLIKAVLIITIGISTLSSFIYGIYISFGRRVGLTINVLTVALWQFLIPLGVMGVWTLMSTIRFLIVIILIITALIYERFISRQKEHN